METSKTYICLSLKVGDESGSQTISCYMKWTSELLLKSASTHPPVPAVPWPAPGPAPRWPAVDLGAAGPLAASRLGPEGAELTPVNHLCSQAPTLDILHANLMLI